MFDATVVDRIPSGVGDINELYASGCSLCGNTKGPYVATRSRAGVQVFLCVEVCCQEAARFAGWVSGDKLAAVAADLEAERQRAAALEADVEAARQDRVVPLADVVKLLEGHAEREHRPAKAKPSGRER